MRRLPICTKPVFRNFLSTLVPCLVLLLVAAPALATPVTYTFEGLTSGSDLPGQDGWVDQPSGSPGAFIDVAIDSGSRH